MAQRVNAASLKVACPACMAPPEQPCTAPTDNGRVAVSWVHLARETAAGTWSGQRAADERDK